MPAHFEFLLEEPSMEAFLKAGLPRFLPEGSTFTTHPFQGKRAFLRNLENRLRGYVNWLPENYRVVIVVDRDDDDCAKLKERLETACRSAELKSKRAAGSDIWRVVTRIAVEELEAWYFGDWRAVLESYPDVPDGIPRKQQFRNPDAVKGRTWERFERVLQKHGYHKGGLPKVEAARVIGERFDADRCNSHSFRCLADALREAAA